MGKMKLSTKIERKINSIQINPFGLGVTLMLLGIYLFPLGNDGLIYMSLVWMEAPMVVFDYFTQANLILYGISIGLFALGFFVLYFNGYKKKAYRLARESSPIKIKSKKRKKKKRRR